MKNLYKVYTFLKPLLVPVIVIVLLQITGQLSKVTSAAHRAILATGALDATASNDEPDTEKFDYSFIAIDLSGRQLTIDSLKNKVVFLNIWAIWCGPCRAEMPTIQKLYDEMSGHGVEFVILSIDQGNPVNKVSSYIKKFNYTFPVYVLSGAPTEQLQVPSIPTTYVISKSGDIVLKEVGMRNYDTDRFKKFLKKETSR